MMLAIREARIPKHIAAMPASNHRAMLRSSLLGNPHAPNLGHWSTINASAGHCQPHRLESEIIAIVEQAREGQILMSFPGFGPITAATIIAAIGSIHNFPLASALKAYFGWVPVVAQSGSTLDASYLTRGGARTIKQIMFLAVMQFIRTALVVPVTSIMVISSFPRPLRAK